jgi:hypothetical protein
MAPLEAETQAADHVVEETVDPIREIIGDDSIAIDKKVLVSCSRPEAIINEAHANGTCSHIVTGTRGHGELADLILGSTSNHVIRDAHCPRDDHQVLMPASRVSRLLTKHCRDRQSREILRWVCGSQLPSQGFRGRAPTCFRATSPRWRAGSVHLRFGRYLPVSHEYPEQFR